VKCPGCKRNTLCSDSRPYVEDTRRRRYVCSCGCRFTTVETVLDVGNNRKGMGGTGNTGTTKLKLFRERQDAVTRRQITAELRQKLDAVLRDPA
jgi:transcriptional regulator NrdR family protein